MARKTSHINNRRKDTAEFDYYRTHPDTVRQFLIQAHHDGAIIPEYISKTLEPCAGELHISNVLKEFGYDVVSRDIIERSKPVEIKNLFDSDKKDLKQFDLVMTNPPFEICTDVTIHFLNNMKEKSLLVQLLKIQFIEGQKRYDEIFSKDRPKYIYAYSRRQACSKDGKDIPQHGGFAFYAWYIWEIGFKGDTTLRWLP